jgi:hypothetical protein
MNKMTWGAILLMVGVGILLESLLADGIGIGNNPHFGNYQIIGTIVGAILTAGGLFLMSKFREL